MSFHPPLSPRWPRVGWFLPLASLLVTPALLATAFVAADINPDRELIITDLAVVESSDEARPGNAQGRFTLEYLLAGLAPDGQAKTALLEWLHAWQSRQACTLWPVGKSVIDQWKLADQAAGETDAAWGPDFAHAPFRLLAIVNRMDLERFDPDAGRLRHSPELRFVFGLCKSDGTPLNATVIFEYSVPADTNAGFLAWADAWHALGETSLGWPEYCRKLADLTERVTKPTGPDRRSHLAQIRTNEQALSGRFTNAPVWNLREFRQDPRGRIVASPTRQTPADKWADSPLLADYINRHAQDILDGCYAIPGPDGGDDFVGFQSSVPKNNRVLWPVNGQAPQAETAQERFAKNTCNGCHGQSTGTGFLHIFPRPRDRASALSFFLRKEYPAGIFTWSEEVEVRRKYLAGLLNQAARLEAYSTNQHLYQYQLALPPPAPVPSERAGRVH